MASGLRSRVGGLMLVTQVDSVGGLALLAIGFVLACVGIPQPSALGIGLVIGSAPPEKAGSASGISETSGEFGIVLVVATMGSIGTAVYRGQLSDSLGSGLPGEAIAAAREGITGAVAAAARCPTGSARTFAHNVPKSSVKSDVVRITSGNRDCRC